MALLTLSQHQAFAAQMVECKLLARLLEIIFNVMKCMTEEELTINKQILVQTENQTPTETPTNVNGADKEQASKTLHINKNESLKETEVISVINQENLRFSILNISNMLVYSEDAKREVLEGDCNENFKANNFHILLNWYTNNNCENLFSDYAYVVTTLSVDPQIRSFMVQEKNQLEHKLKKYLLHDNNKIRQNTIKAIRN